MFAKCAYRVLAWGLFAALMFSAQPPAQASSSHARIVRLSLVQGDVRFARSSNGDPLSDGKTAWEAAVLNLPMRQGYVLATDSGRAEVEFENGAMAFLSDHTVLEFYDLSLNDGALTTRLVLRQGTGSFYVNPVSADYFSVTGGDFTVEATGKTHFRLDNFDDGSTVEVLKGRLNVLRNKETTPLDKGQSFTAKAGDDAAPLIGRLPDEDDFDRWVSGRVDSVVTATRASLQYTSYSPYTAGFADLTTYGSWFPVGGYGACWRPFGVGLGWSPYSSGSWYFDPFFGWLFFGNAAWGWAPYHYGSWLFQPGLGWVWYPGGFNGFGPNRWRSVNAVFVRAGGTLAAVPAHPLDARGKTPVNLANGAVSVTSRAGESVVSDSREKWRVVKSPSRTEVSATAFTAATPPARLSRSLVAAAPASRSAAVGGDSSIVFDSRERRFVNNESAPQAASAPARPASGNLPPPMVDRMVTAGQPPVAPRAAPSVPAAPVTARVPGVPPPSRAVTAPPPAPRAVTPPAPRGSAAGRGNSESTGGSSAGSSRGGGSPHPVPAPSSAPRSGGRPR